MDATQTSKRHEPVRTFGHDPDPATTLRIRCAKLTSDNSGLGLLMSPIRSRNNEDLTTSVKQRSMSVWSLGTLQLWLPRPYAKIEPSQATNSRVMSVGPPPLEC